MLVRIKVQTNFQKEKLFVGDEHEVSDAVAQRWAKCGIAEIIAEEKVKSPKEMTAKELYKLCIDKGIEVAEKQPKAVYLEALGLKEDAE